MTHLNLQNIHQSLHPALWYSVDSNLNAQCLLCPRHCVIPPKQFGFCGVRYNHDGFLKALTWGHPMAIQIDPIEKKPIVGFLKGTQTLSIGTLGCNLNCLFCQNYQLSRSHYLTEQLIQPEILPIDIIKLAKQNHCQSISLTYNEPTVFYEYMLDIAKLAKENKIPIIMVSNGFIEEQPARKLFPFISAMNIDMKGFSSSFYKTLCQGELAPILKTILLASTFNIHVEITQLIIPKKNDNIIELEQFLMWLAHNLSLEINLHFSAFSPTWKLTEIEATPPELLYKIRSIAVKKGFKNIHLGNI